MREVPRDWLEFLREQYPKGSRVRLSETGTIPTPFLPVPWGLLTISTIREPSM